MKKYIWLLLLFLFGVFAIAPLLRSCEKEKIKPNEGVVLIQSTPFVYEDLNKLDNTPEQEALAKKAESLDSYVRKAFWLNDGGIPTKIIANKPNELILSESYGLALNAAFIAENKDLFNSIYNIAMSKLRVQDDFSWQYDTKKRSLADANSTIDDLRVIKALLDAHNLWHDPVYKSEALRMAAVLKNKAFVNGQLVSFYNFSDGQASQEVHVPFLDLEAMQMLSVIDPDWTPILETAQATINGSFISEAFPMYYPIYNVETAEYSPQKAFNTTEGLVTVLHLAQIKSVKLETIQWISAQLDKGAIYGEYTHEGLPTTKIESSAIYATVVLIGEALGDPALTNKAMQKLLTLQTQKSGTLFNKGNIGAFEDNASKTAYSYDNLMALWAMNEKLRAYSKE